MLEQTETTQVRSGRPRGIPKTGGRKKGSRNRPKVPTLVPTAVAAAPAAAGGGGGPSGGVIPVSRARARETAHPGLKIRYKRLDDLREYERNANEHSPAQIKLIERLLTRFGWTNNMAEAGGVLIYGHARRRAAMNLRDRGVAIPRNPDPDKGPVVDLSHLNAMERRAYRIADNESARKATIDNEMMAEELRDMRDIDEDFDQTLTGYDEDQLAGFLNDDEDEHTGSDNAEEAMVTCPNCHHAFAP